MLDSALSFERLDRVLFPVPSGRVHSFDVQADVAGRRFRRELPRAALLGRLDNRPPSRPRCLRLRLTTDACDRPVVEQYRPRRRHDLRLPIRGRRPQEVHRVYVALPGLGVDGFDV